MTFMLTIITVIIIIIAYLKLFFKRGWLRIILELNLNFTSLYRSEHWFTTSSVTLSAPPVINVPHSSADFGHNPSRVQWTLKSPFMWLQRQNNSDIRPLLRDQRHFWRFLIADRTCKMRNKKDLQTNLLRRWSNRIVHSTNNSSINSFLLFY